MRLARCDLGHSVASPPPVVGLRVRALQRSLHSECPLKLQGRLLFKRNQIGLYYSHWLIEND
jgi:hypothetical protein